MIESVNLTVQAGAFRLGSVNFRIPTGSYCVLMGKTGCGKTTLLEAVCGLKRVISGEIRIFGENVAHLKAAERGIGFVPQDGALFATMTIRDHLEFAMRVRRWPRRRIAARVDELASLLDVEDLLARKPFGLSGGESQRVALGRALSFQPRVLCLDEPLSALDDDTRMEMVELLKRVQKEMGVTALHVTHNRSEAERLADVRLQIVDGQVVELQMKDA